MSNLSERFARIRAEKASVAAASVAPVEHVVVTEHPVGRTVRALPAVPLHDRGVRSPVVARALRGELPTHRDLPME